MLVFLSGKSHGQRNLAGYSPGYSPWGCKRVRHDLVTKQCHANRSVKHFIQQLKFMPFYVQSYFLRNNMQAYIIIIIIIILLFEYFQKV